jgi:hypothetical protein
MMRRLFWASAGAVVGVAGYRKAARLARGVWPPASGGGDRHEAPPRPARRGTSLRASRGAIRGVRGATSFARDVRRGMDLYLERYSELTGPSLGGQQARVRRAPSARSGESDPGREYPDINYAKDGR